MAAKTVQQDAVSEKLIGRWDQATKKLVDLAEEIPEEKFDYTPANDVRNCADVLRHVAFWNLYVAHRARGEEADESANELSKNQFSTKRQIINALQRSNRDALNALKGADLNADMAEMLVTFIEHNSEHYGQLVVYARLNGIVPPASRG